MPYSTDHKLGEHVVFIGDEEILQFEHVYKIRGIDANGNLALCGDPRNLVYSKDYFVNVGDWMNILHELAQLMKV